MESRDDVYIHPTARVSPRATLRKGAWIGPRCVVDDNVVVGQYSVIGGTPEHSGFYDDVRMERSKGVVLEWGAKIFEFVTIQAGTERPTTIGTHSGVFQHSHVSHDCQVGAYCTVSGRASLAGFVNMMLGSTVGAHSIVHQHCVLGAYGFLGMASALKGHVPPGETWFGSPAKQIGFNTVGLARASLSIETAQSRFASDYEKLIGGSRLK